MEHIPQTDIAKLSTYQGLDIATIPVSFIVFGRTHTVVFHSYGFYNVPLVLIVYARSFQALPSWTKWHTGLDVTLLSIQCQTRWIYTQAALLWISKVQGYGHVCSGWSLKKTCKINISFKATKNTWNSLF